MSIQKIKEIANNIELEKCSKMLKTLNNSLTAYFILEQNKDYIIDNTEDEKDNTNIIQEKDERISDLKEQIEDYKKQIEQLHTIILVTQKDNQLLLEQKKRHWWQIWK